MVAVWLGIVGRGQPHHEVYALQGVDRLKRERGRSGGRRWRTPKRWAERHLTDLSGTTWKQRVQAFLLERSPRVPAM
jgi:hypothetical protein